MKPKSIIVFLSFIFMSTITTKAQTNTSREYITIFIEGVNSTEDALSIDAYLRNQTGVITSRMDARTNKYFGVYSSASGITIDNFKSWFTNLGYTATCGRTGRHGVGNTTLIKREECDTELSTIKITNP